MRKLLFFFIFLFILPSSFAAEYFIQTDNGRDIEGIQIDSISETYTLTDDVAKVEILLRIFMNGTLLEDSTSFNLSITHFGLTTQGPLSVSPAAFMGLPALPSNINISDPARSIYTYHLTPSGVNDSFKVTYTIDNFLDKDKSRFPLRFSIRCGTYGTRCPNNDVATLNVHFSSSEAVDLSPISYPTYTSYNSNVGWWELNFSSLSIINQEQIIWLENDAAISRKNFLYVFLGALLGGFVSIFIEFIKWVLEKN